MNYISITFFLRSRFDIDNLQEDTGSPTRETGAFDRSGIDYAVYGVLSAGAQPS
jgi:hypothetical protein